MEIDPTIHFSINDIREIADRKLTFDEQVENIKKLSEADPNRNVPSSFFRTRSDDYLNNGYLEKFDNVEKYLEELSKVNERLQKQLTDEELNICSHKLNALKFKAAEFRHEIQKINELKIQNSLKSPGVSYGPTLISLPHVKDNRSESQKYITLTEEQVFRTMRSIQEFKTNTLFSELKASTNKIYSFLQGVVMKQNPLLSAEEILRDTELVDYSHAGEYAFQRIRRICKLVKGTSVQSDWIIVKKGIKSFSSEKVYTRKDDILDQLIEATDSLTLDLKQKSTKMQT